MELDKKTKKELAEKMKYEVAEELGLLDKVKKEGWKGLTAREAGQIGGVVARKNKEIKNKAKNK